MNSQTHEELLELVGELWKEYPHWRLGQLLSNVAGWIDQDLWDADDEQMLPAIRLHLQERRQRERTVQATS